ncbi:unnamed protein product [Cylicocyclus nassatus]|uniref:Uncharacterized protein n=1 Tax=Cylicocyclus nassatus TaxID=53992 RepID=A0AA36DLS5_CYLNA|nr:unnamed protein product [Cylicocyclus nassatus]
MQITSGIMAGNAATSACAGLGSEVVPAVVCYSYDAATTSSINSPHSSMEIAATKQQRPSTASATDCVRRAAVDHILEYSTSATFTENCTSDALQIAREQLRKIYIAEASLLRNMEECSSSSDLDSLVEALQRLRNFESDVQRRLFSHLRLLQP